MKIFKKRKLFIFPFIFLPAMVIIGFYVLPKNPWLNKSSVLAIKYADKLNSYWYGLSNKVSFNIT